MSFGPGQAAVLAELCDAIVPGSVATGALEYIERAVGGMSAAEEDRLHAAIGLLSTGDLGRLTGTAAFALVRRLAIEAYYGDFTPPGYTGPTPHETIGFTPPAAAHLRKDWTFLGRPADGPAPADGRGRPATDPHWADDPYGMTTPVPDEADIVVVGSGAGGGLIAAELGSHGHDVLVLEAGGYHPAESHTRFELGARHHLWWPTRFAETGEDCPGPVALLAGRCVGGSTVINTKVAMRAPAHDFDRWPFPADLDYDRVERALGVRERNDWTPSVHRLATGFAALDTKLEPVRSYTDANCTRCGACLTGCPSNAGKSALNTFLAPALANNQVRVRTHCTVDQVLIENNRVTGVRYNGNREVRAKTVVVAAGALNTPLILRRSNTPNANIGRYLGLHPARLVYGRFDEPQDCHRAYPITAHCLSNLSSFLVEGTTIQDPVAFAESLIDPSNRPLWGRRLHDTGQNYRHWAGLLAMANDENTGVVELGADDDAVVTKRFSETERVRLADALAFSVAALRAAGAREVVWSGLSTTHVQGTARMGVDPARSVVDPTGRSHDVAGLYVGDASLVPVSLSVNPSLTVMALAARVADALHEELT
ncbi:FAD-dependent oxidoreductase [Cryptosporangium sp. NPDC048952]|uniref:FAD-dependent oxidoreductase n=1 Tax=Cryptosporangium sp. NPDC048952 TaxID=3363961 RepID=UPI00371FF096